MTRTFNYIFKHLLTMLCLLAVVSCTDELAVEQSGTVNPLNQDKGIGELVLFSSGNASNSTTRAVIPYMEQEGRFVCKMYYHAKATDTDASEFDTENTPIISWLRVNNKEGNSVYWNREFPDKTGDGLSDYRDLSDADRNDANYKDYGFDPNAQFFYWRNRLDHIFLAYTDFNLLKKNKWEWSTNTDAAGNTLPKSRALFMYPEADGEKKTKVGQKETWPESLFTYRKLVFQNYDRPNPEYTQWAEENPNSTETNPYPEKISVLEYKTEQQTSTYPVLTTWNHFPLTYQYDSDFYGTPNAVIKATYQKVLDIIDASVGLSTEARDVLKSDLMRIKEHGDVEQTSEGNFRNARWWVGYDPAATDAVVDGTVNFGSASAVLYCRREKQKIVDEIKTAPANVFDMRRSATMDKIADQPDPLIALTRMKPTGATQEANRVRLYFKHQFSQIQVNLTKGENTPELSGENIVSVELLGVTEKGYVFTNINPDGTQIPPSYDAVVLSKYTEAQLKKNPYGTSFEMFDMKEDKQQTALKSFNAIAFGQLQAIRITWKEEPTGENYTAETAQEENDKHLVENDGKKPGEEGYVAKYEEGYTPVTAGQEIPPVHHVATYKITVDERGQSLVNLKSGYRYVYDFELRRGTIAFIRATIDGWLLSDDLNYGTSGTIKNE